MVLDDAERITYWFGDTIESDPFLLFSATFTVEPLKNPAWGFPTPS